MAKTSTTTKSEETKATKTSTTKSTTKKSTTSNTDTAKALDEALKIIAEMKSEMEELKQQNNNTVVVQSEPTSRKKVKCISLSHHPVNVSTMPSLGGKVFQFVNYGQIIQINYDDILDIIASYPNTIASGLVYICDKEIIEDNGLTEAYSKVYDKETMDKVVFLRNEADAELILGMNEELRESALIEVVRLYKAGERMNGGAIATLRENGVDIVELAKETVI